MQKEINYQTPEADHDSIRAAMQLAWTDHQYTRDQTWNALKMEFFLILTVMGANWQTSSNTAIIVSMAFVCFIVLCGIQITIRHRNKVELKKFAHILNCEEKLGLHSDTLISDVKLPKPITFWSAFNPFEGNTSLFILRMHLAIMGFALFLLISKLNY